MTILDEAQTVPTLFSALRGAIDSRREDRRCHFCILGSAQPALIRGVSESLAGRVGWVELDPLTPQETGLDVATHWLAGGFPEALRGNFRTWWEPYLSTVLQRDLAAYGFRPDALFLRRLLTMLAAQQGGLLNLSALGNALGVSYHTVQHGLDLLEGVFLIRRLPPTSAISENGSSKHRGFLSATPACSITSSIFPPWRNSTTTRAAEQAGRDSLWKT